MNDGENKEVTANRGANVEAANVEVALEAALAFNPEEKIIEPPPDGGLKAWLFTFGGFLLFFNSWGMINSFGAFQTYYKLYLFPDVSNSTISWIGSVQSFLVVVLSVFTGRALDAAYERAILCIGGFLVVFGLMMTSLSKEFYQAFLAQGICVGIGGNFIFMSAITIVSQYFDGHRSFALGVQASGSSFGGVIYPIVVHRLIPQIGFPWTARVLGFMALGTSIIPIMFMRTRLPPRRSGPLIDIPSLTDIPYLIFCGSLFFGFLTIYIPIFYIQSYAIEVGIEENLAFYLVAMVNAGSIGGRLLPNFFADKIGPLNMLTPGIFVCLIMQFAWIGVKSEGLVIPFAVLYGFFSGAFVSLPPACIALMTRDHTILGTRLGMCFFISSFGTLVGSPIAGALLSRDNGGYLYAQLFAGVGTAIGLTMLLTVRFLIKGPKLFVKV